MHRTNNPFETAARALKVQRLLAAVPTGNGAAVASRLAAFTAAERGVFAAGVGVNVPSDATWTALCDAVRARRTCDCGAALPTTGTPANEDGMALGAGETAAMLLVDCRAAVHGGKPRTFAIATVSL